MEDTTYVLRLQQVEVDEERLEGQPDDVEDLEDIGINDCNR